MRQYASISNSFSHLATFLGTNSLSMLMCRKAVNQSISQTHSQTTLPLEVVYQKNFAA